MGGRVIVCLMNSIASIRAIGNARLFGRRLADNADKEKEFLIELEVILSDFRSEETDLDA